ncbi:hypothetical protein ACI2K4_30065 [Micromonospora sp. NPDC050397]|uniref:hypothetical protein n=1 Tax=Micromonospora sp. NPDC050397 TaxID=3364279 RepID=UPI00384CDA72
MTGRPDGQEPATVDQGRADGGAPPAADPAAADSSPATGPAPAAADGTGTSGDPPAPTPPTPAQQQPDLPIPAQQAAGVPVAEPPAGPPAPTPTGLPAPTGPTGAAGSPWLAAPVSAGIEPTTGAPHASLPARVPRINAAGTRTVPSADGTQSAAPPSAISSPPLAPEDEDDFWLPIEQVNWDGTPARPDPDDGPRRLWSFPIGRVPAGASPRLPKPPRRVAPGLAGLVLLALLASFFAWVSVEPLWLAFGHGDLGTATVIDCTGQGLNQRCRGEFVSADGRFSAEGVRLAGVPAEEQLEQWQLTARMIDAESDTAYVGAGTGPLHLRWILGLTLVLLCGVGIVWSTGAVRLPDRSTRRGAVIVGLAGPLVITVGFLAASF